MLNLRCATCEAGAEVMRFRTWSMTGGFQQMGWRGECPACAERNDRDEAHEAERNAWEAAKGMMLVVITGLFAVSRVTTGAWAIRWWRNGWSSTVSVDLWRWRLELGPGVRA